MDMLSHIQALEQTHTGDYAYLGLLGKVKKALDSAKRIQVPATDIRPFAGQPREYFDEESIRRLSRAISGGGQTTAGLIRENPAETPYELIDGERRWRSIMIIPEDTRPLYKADLIEADDEVIQFLIAGIANFNRVGHTALEIMRTIDQYHVVFKIPMAEVAGLIGISVMWAEQMLGLKNLAPEVAQMLDPSLPKDKMLPVTAAIKISKIDPEYQLGLAQRVLDKTISLSRLRGEVVKVARRAGAPVRTRDVSPLHQFESFSNKLEVIARTVEDAESILGKREINMLLKNRPGDTAKLLKKLRDAQATLASIESRVDGLLT